jgi:hypothetical protein
MRPMVEHIFEQSKFVAEFPSAAQNPISVNSLRNVQLKFLMQTPPDP